MTEPACDSLLVERSGGVITVTINRPRRKNAMDLAAWLALGQILRDVADDPAVRVLVLTGAGDDFCAGADIVGERTEHPLNRARKVNDVALALHELPVPTIARVRGVAVGAGWNLALGCDIVVAARDARFSQIFARRGLSVDFGGSWLLPRIVGLQQAKRLTLLAEMLSAEEAERLGLVTYLVEPEEIDDVVAGLAGRLAAGPPIALGQTKALLNHGATQTFREALDGEARAQTVNYAGSDASTAFSAFRDKREPEFTGAWNAR